MLLVLGVLARQDAEAEAEHLFAKLRALVCDNQFLLLIVLVVELARRHVHLYEGDVGRAQYGVIFMFLCTYLLFLLPGRPH